MYNCERCHCDSTTSELENHMDGAACLQIVVTDLHLVSELSASENETDLTDFDTFLLLQGLLNLKDRVVRLEVIALLAAGKGLSTNVSKQSSTYFYKELHIYIYIINNCNNL